MMLRGIVADLRATAQLLGEAGLTGVDPGPTAFGAGGPGVLGEVGREAAMRWQSALDARTRETRAHATRVGEVAEAVARAADATAGADADARFPDGVA
jgi:hypothetical protein